MKSRLLSLSAFFAEPAPLPSVHADAAAPQRAQHYASLLSELSLGEDISAVRKSTVEAPEQQQQQQLQ